MEAVSNLEAVEGVWRADQEELGAVATVIQVAQFGVQLSTTLFKIADAVKSANKETHIIARDLSLFCEVLNNLGHALQRGHNSGLYKQGAYVTSLKIMNECKIVFGDIEEILRKTTKSKTPLDGQFIMPRAEKFLWGFRKSKVEFLQGVLASLKSTILIELAVMDYAARVTSPKAEDTVDVTSLLALKDLVIDNERATEHMRELDSLDDVNDEERAGDIALHGIASIDRITPANQLLALGASPNQDGTAAVSTTEASNRTTHSLSSITGTLRAVNEESADDYFCEATSQVDRYEHALRKLSLMRWEQEHLSAIKDGASERSAIYDSERATALRMQLSEEMFKFGMSAKQIEAAFKLLDGYSSHLGRMPISYEISDPALKYDPALQPLFGELTDERGYTVVTHRLPSLFDDVVWMVGNRAMLRSRHHAVPSPMNEDVVSNLNVNTGPSRKRSAESPSRDTYYTTVRTVKEVADILNTANPADEAQHKAIQTDSDHASRTTKRRMRLDFVTSARTEESTSSTDALEEDQWQLRGSQTTELAVEPLAQPGTPTDQVLLTPNELAQARQHEILRRVVQDWLYHEAETPSAQDVPDGEFAVVETPRRGEPSQDFPDLVTRMPPNDLVPISTSQHDDEESDNTSDSALQSATFHRAQPHSSTDAMALFHSRAGEQDSVSCAATWGSHVDEDFDMALYQAQQIRGMQGRYLLFRSNQNDSHLQTVEALLHHWTIVNDLVPLREMAAVLYSVGAENGGPSPVRALLESTLGRTEPTGLMLRS